MATVEQERWHRARGYAIRQGCDAPTACEYADYITGLVRSGAVTLPAAHGPVFRAWMRANGAQ